MKKFYLISFLSLFYFNAQSQDFLGIGRGNFSGISGVMLQPASIVDSRYKFDVNLFSTSVNYSNNYFLVNRDAILKFNKNNFNDYQTFKARYLSEANLATGERVFLNVNNRTQIPLSFMATTGKKSAIALNIQSRSMIQGRGITQELAKMAYNGFYFPPLNNSTIDASGFNLNALNWAEVGFTYGRVLYASDRHFFKAAITGKYLAGVASINMGSNDIRLSVNSDSSINFNSNRFDYNHNKNADFDMAFNKNFSPDANAVGFDAGLVYEYRGNFKKFKYMRNDDEKSYLADRRDVNKYIFKLGVSLLDVGMFRFQKPDNVNSFNANITNWNLASANYNTIREFDTALANRVAAIPGSKFYNAYLPAALSVQFDLRFVKGFYLNAMAYRPVNIGKDAGQRFNGYGFYAITPRWESRHIGIYIPYTISDKNSLTNYRGNLLGATVRLGPLFIGSSNLGTMLFNENLKAADVHLGLKIGITYGKPNKSSTYMDRLFSKKDDAELPLKTAGGNKSNDTMLITKGDPVSMQKNDTSRLLLDYNKGKVYDNPNSKGNIIIVNNYYYGNAPVTSVIKSDSSNGQAMLAEYYKQLNLQKDSVLLQKNNAEIDQKKKIIADSINYKKYQLDSLIRDMQLLRTQMDSVNVKDSSGISILPANKSSLVDDNNYILGLQQIADTIAARNVIRSFSDSMDLVVRMDSLAGDNANIKKKSFGDNKISVAKSDTPSFKADTMQVVKSQQKESKPLGGKASVEKKSVDSSNLIIATTDRKNAAVNAVPLLNDQQKGLKPQTSKVLVAKNGIDSSEGRVAVNDPKAVKSAPATVVKDQQKELKIPLNPSPAADIYNREREMDQERLLNEFRNETSRIRNDIARLQASAVENNRNYRGDNTLVPIILPSAKNEIVYKPAPVIRDTIYIRDTVKLSDTIRITNVDTVTLLVDKPVIKKVPMEIAAPRFKVLRDTIVKEASFDYTVMPETIILFGLGKSAVQQVYFKRLDFIAGVLLKEKALQVAVTGHADKSGSPEINRTLSLKRAQNISTYLQSRGVSNNQINTTAVSYLEPAVEGNTKNANSQNRRVVIQFLQHK